MHIINMSSPLPSGSIVLVTGINSYIGSHVADQLLEAGFNVRGTVRDIRKVGGLLNLWEDKFRKEKVELVIVKDFSAPGAFNVAVQGL
jgi:nucleoside-diphosphate-sugar epimerase